MYLGSIKESTEKLYKIANNPNIAIEEFGDVLFEICEILKRLPSQRSFQRDLARITELKENYNNEYKNIISSYGSFAEFFIHEQGLLLDYKLNRDIVLALGAEAESLYANVYNQEVSEEELLASIESLKNYICSFAGTLLKSSDIQIISEKGMQGLTGLSIAGINLKSLPLEMGLPGGSLILSTGTGIFLIKNSVAESHLFGRIMKFFRRRLP